MKRIALLSFLGCLGLLFAANTCFAQFSPAINVSNQVGWSALDQMAVDDEGNISLIWSHTSNYSNCCYLPNTFEVFFARSRNGDSFSVPLALPASGSVWPQVAQVALDKQKKRHTSSGIAVLQILKPAPSCTPMKKGTEYSPNQLIFHKALLSGGIPKSH